VKWSRDAGQRFEANADTKRGGDHKSEEARSKCTVHIDSQVDRAQRNGISRRTQIYLDHLARDAPELLERVQAGELKPKTAARLAGIVRERTTWKRSYAGYRS
jgi:hypothetical protein